MAQFSPRGRPKYGAPISVIDSGRVEPAIFITKKSQNRHKQWWAVLQNAPKRGWFPDGRFGRERSRELAIRPQDEGVTWARGQAGEAVDALVSMVALTQESA